MELSRRFPLNDVLETVRDSEQGFTTAAGAVKDPHTKGHRGWMNLKSRIAALDDKAIISEAERGEDVAKAAYAKALKEDLSAGARRLLEDQAEIVRITHDEVRALEKRQ